MAVDHKADMEYAFLFLAKQLASCKAMASTNTAAPLVSAQNFYLDRMDSITKKATTYIKYKKLRTFHKKAICEAKLFYRINSDDKRLDVFAEEHFDYYACINNARYNGPFGSPACRSTSPIIVKLLRGARLW